MLEYLSPGLAYLLIFCVPAAILIWLEHKYLRNKKFKINGRMVSWDQIPFTEGLSEMSIIALVLLVGVIVVFMLIDR